MRRKFLKPAVAKKYNRFSSANVPLIVYLLGDDIDKQRQSVNRHKKTGAQMTTENSRKRSYDRDYQQSSMSHRSNYGVKSDSVFFVLAEGRQSTVQKGKRLQFPEQQCQKEQVNALKVFNNLK